LDERDERVSAQMSLWIYIDFFFEVFNEDVVELSQLILLKLLD